MKCSVVLTSCGRIDLLDKTIKSFNKFNDYPIEEFILIDDSGDRVAHEGIRECYSDYTLILNKKNRGLIECIDDAYSRVSTEYIMHIEDDWEFIKGGFIEKSIKILEDDKKIIQVWIRGYDDTNGHPIEEYVFHVGGVEYRLLKTGVHGFWHGFTFNPGVRKKSDYLLLAPYAQYDKEFNIAVRECRIGGRFYEMGYRAAILKDQYCFHIGNHRTTYTH